jgi:peptide/nickel transport system permease protein
MRAYIVSRLLLNIPVVLLAITLVFLASHAMTDYATRRVASSLTGAANLDEAIKQVRHELGTDRPLHIQYLNYIGDVLHGDLGDSLLTKRPVLTELKLRLPPSLELGLLDLVVALTVSIPIGIISAIRQDSWIDYVLRFLAILWLAIPSFYLAVLLLILCFKVIGWTPPLTVTAYHNFPSDPVKNLQMLALPAIAGGIATGASIMRLLRSQMLEVLRQDYVRTAWAKGLRERTVVMRHALKNALIPVLTIAGLLVGVLFSGNVILETMFSIPGIGLFLVTSIRQNDFPVVDGIVLVVAIVLVFTNLAVDLAYAWLDPRIRYG